jgi:hypothetical protein
MAGRRSKRPHMAFPERINFVQGPLVGDDGFNLAEDM